MIKPKTKPVKREQLSLGGDDNIPEWPFKPWARIKVDIPIAGAAKLLKLVRHEGGSIQRMEWDGIDVATNDATDKKLRELAKRCEQNPKAPPSRSEWERFHREQQELRKTAVTLAPPRKKVT